MSDMYGKNKKLISLEPKRILIVRLSALGDVVCGLPVLAALRSKFPRTEIAWLVEENAASLIKGHKYIDKLITVRKGWLKSLTQIISLRKKLLAYAPDLTVDMQSLLKSSVAAWLSGAKNRIGFGGKHGREGSCLFNNIKVITNQTHAIDRNMQLIEALGISGVPIEFDLPENDSDKTAIEQMMQNLKISGHFAVLNVGASTECKKWLPERFTELGRYLFTKWNLPVLVIAGSEQERKLASQIAAASHSSISLTPELSLP
ncbi:MAG: glycosyltransferase family 9 protein, partial [Thermoguttaceae bacterium]